MVKAVLTGINLQRSTDQMVYAATKLALDQQKTDLSQAIEGVNSDVTAVQGDLSSLQDTVEAHAAELDDHETRIAALEGP